MSVAVQPFDPDGAVAERHRRPPVADQDQALPPRGQAVLKAVQDLGLRRGVQAFRRFVQHQPGRIAQIGARQAKTPSFSAG